MLWHCGSSAASCGRDAGHKGVRSWVDWQRIFSCKGQWIGWMRIKEIWQAEVVFSSQQTEFKAVQRVCIRFKLQQNNLILQIQMLQRFLATSVLLIAVVCTKFSLTLESYQKQCFFQILQSQQKYSIDVTAQGQGLYEVEVSNMVGGQWSSVHYRQSKSPYQSINIHKLAGSESTYSYCLRNQDSQRLKLRVEIQSGLELLEFELLPGKSDAQNLERELGWLQKEKAKLFESLQRMEALRATSEGLSNLVSTKMVGFAIAGLVAIIVVNLLFYRELRKTFKERKLI